MSRQRPGEDLSLERTVLKYAAALGLGLLLLVGYPAYQDATARGDIATGHLSMHRATVLDTNYDSGWDGDSNWVSQEIELQLDDGTRVTKPMNGAVINVDSGDGVSVGLSRGRLVSVNGESVRTHSVSVVFVLPILSGILVLVTIYAVLLRSSDPAHRYPYTVRYPYTAGYVTQSVLLCFVALVALPELGQFEVWRSIIVLAGATGIPLIIFWRRCRQRDRSPDQPSRPEIIPGPGGSQKALGHEEVRDPGQERDDVVSAGEGEIGVHIGESGLKRDQDPEP